eukprot:scaffold17829_cov30-Tisochrysis_lutea.AAC.4
MARQQADGTSLLMSCNSCAFWSLRARHATTERHPSETAARASRQSVRRRALPLPVDDRPDSGSAPAPFAQSSCVAAQPRHGAHRRAAGAPHPTQPSRVQAAAAKAPLMLPPGGESADAANWEATVGARDGSVPLRPRTSRWIWYPAHPGPV